MGIDFSQFNRLLVLSFFFSAFLSATELQGLTDFEQAVNADNYRQELAAFASKYLGPATSPTARAQLLSEIKAKRENYLDYIVSVAETEIQDPAIRSTIAGSVIQAITNPNQLDSLFIHLRGISKEHPELLYNRGLALLRELPQEQKNEALASRLMAFGAEIPGDSNFPAGDIRFLFEKGATGQRSQELVLERLPEGASELLLSLLKSKGEFQGSYFSPQASVYSRTTKPDQISPEDLAHVQKLIREDKVRLSESQLRQITQNVFDPEISPEAKAIAYELIKRTSGSLAEEVIDRLIQSPHAIDHLMAETLLSQSPSKERQQRLQQNWKADLLTTEDPVLLSLLARSPFSAGVNWTGQDLSPKEVEGMKRLIQHPDEKVAAVVLDAFSSPKISQRLMGELLKEYLFKAPKAGHSSSVLPEGINESLSQRLRDLVKKFPTETKAQQQLMLQALQDPQVHFSRKRDAFEILQQIGSEEAALPALLTQLTAPERSEKPNELLWMAERASRLAPGQPDVYQRFKGALEKKLKEASSFPDKMAVAKVMSHMGAPEGISFIMNEIKKPIDPAAPENNRPNYSLLAESLGAALKKNPQLLTPELRKELLGILASKDPGLTAAQNDLNKFLPPTLLAELDPEIAKDRLHPSNIDPCSVMCRLASALSQKLDESHGLKSDAYLKSSEAKNSFGFAVRSLVGEFLLKANQSGCSIPGIQEKVSKLITEASDYARGDAQETEATRAAVRESLRTFKGSKDAVRRALAFTDRVSNVDDSGLPTNSATLYFYLQVQRAAEALRQSGFEFDSDAMDALQKKAEDHLTKVTHARAKLLSGEGGSLLTSYALAAIGASMPQGSELQKRIAQIFSDLREEYKKAGGEGFPYNFNPELLKQSERGGAARSVVAQLAIYKGGNAQDRLLHADQLLMSLSAYDKHFRDIFSGIGLNRTHDYMDGDQLAPYYGPSTIPYVFEALALLGKEKELSAEQKQKVEMLKSSLEKKLLGMFEPDGLFKEQNSSYYSGAPLYDNALTGLALEQVCRDKKSTTATGEAGVISPSKRAPAQKGSTPEKNHELGLDR